jgi:hypothetical protein
MTRDELIARLKDLRAEAADLDEETAAAFDLFIPMVGSDTEVARATRVVEAIERRALEREGAKGSFDVVE